MPEIHPDIHAAIDAEFARAYGPRLPVRPQGGPMPDTPTQHPASTSDARKRAADLATPDWGSDLREPLDLDAIRARAEAFDEAWGWHEQTDDMLAGHGHHMMQMLYRLPVDGQTSDMKASIEGMLTDVPDLLAEVERLARWKAEALPVLVGLQELGRALDLPLGERITGQSAAEAAQALLARAEKAEAEVERLREARDSHLAARNVLAKMAVRLEAQLAEAWRTSRALPCDGLCSEYAEGDCSLHGREPAELWEAIAAKNARAEKAEAEVERLRAEVEHWKARRDAAVETCRYLHQDGLTAEEWHVRICAAAQGALRERARAEKAEAERDAACEALARVEALADEWERNYTSMLVGGFSGCSIGADSAAKRIRAALAQPATDEGAGA